MIFEARKKLCETFLTGGGKTLDFNERNSEYVQYYDNLYIILDVHLLCGSAFSWKGPVKNPSLTASELVVADHMAAEIEANHRLRIIQ